MIKEIKINGMSCAHCVAAIEKELKKLNPEKLNVRIGLVMIECDDKSITNEEIKLAVQEAGFEVVEPDN